jgi:hypothetical protein
MVEGRPAGSPEGIARVKVVVWNMNHRVRSWEALEKLDPDLALLNEARVPKTLGMVPQGGERTLGRDGYRREWAAAIVSKHQLRPVLDAKAFRQGRPLHLPFETSRPGSWEAAVVGGLGEEDVTAVSLYGLLDEKSDASVHRSLSELAPLFEDPRYNKLLLLGGDLNILANPRPNDPTRERHLLVLARIKAYGLVDCLEKAVLGRNPPRGGLKGCSCRLAGGCTHVWTHRHGQSQTPYQDDYLFASRSLAEKLLTCEAPSPLEWSEFSDHSPILASFED